jgi:hypothetical protein
VPGIGNPSFLADQRATTGDYWPFLVSSTPETSKREPNLRSRHRKLKKGSKKSVLDSEHGKTEAFLTRSTAGTEMRKDFSGSRRRKRKDGRKKSVLDVENGKKEAKTWCRRSSFVATPLRRRAGKRGDRAPRLQRFW